MLRDAFLPEAGKTRFIFFSGKGGVGKSTLAAATAVWLADQGYRTLLVSTDLQRSQDDIFQQTFGFTPTPVQGTSNLWALNTDVEMNISQHQLRQMQVVENILGDVPELGFLKEHYSVNPCCETAAWNRMTEFMNTQEYQAVVFDTAPGGHSLETIMYPIKQVKNLHSLIQAKRASAELAGKEADVAVLEEIVRQNDQAIATMKSPQTRYNLIMHPRRLPLFEAERLIEALARFGFKADGLVINELLPDSEVEASSQFFKDIRSHQKKYAREAEGKFNHMTIARLPLQSREVVGLAAVRALAARLFDVNQTSEG